MVYSPKRPGARCPGRNLEENHLKHILQLGLLLVLALGAQQSASAGLIGATIDGCTDSAYTGSVTTDTAACNSVNVGLTSPSAIVVDPGAEFFLGSTSRQVDFADNTVTVRYLSYSGSPSADLFIFTGLPGTISGLTLLTSNDLNVTTAFTGTSIGLLVNAPECCSDFTAESTFRIDYRTVSEVPEPGTFAAAGLGLALVWLRRRRG